MRVELHDDHHCLHSDGADLQSFRRSVFVHFISEEHQARGIAYGWYVERLTGRDWGHYGRDDDGTFASNLTPGNNHNECRPAMDDAVAAWNSQAPGLGHDAFPAFDKLTD